MTRKAPEENSSASSKANREKLEAKFKAALTSLYEAFEEAFQFDHPEFIADLRNHLIKSSVTQIISLFASSQCRSCYRGRRMDAVWRLRRFETLLPYMAEVPLESYRRAEDHRANVLLDKTALVTDGPLTDKYRLGLSAEDQRLYASLRAAGLQSFDEELSALANINSLICMRVGRIIRTLLPLRRLTWDTTRSRRSVSSAGKISFPLPRCSSIGIMIDTNSLWHQNVVHSAKT